jgi:predicted RNase H-like HicB family nuclease
MEIVRVVYHHESDGWSAEPPDVDGLSAAGESYAEVVKAGRRRHPLRS